MTDNKHEFEHAFVKDNLIFLKSCNSFSQRQIGEVKNDDIDSSIAFFKSRFIDLELQIKSVGEKVEQSNNPGSFLVKLKHEHEKLNEFQGIGDFDSLASRLESLINQIEETISSNKLKNSIRKQELLDQLKTAIENPNWKESFEHVKTIQQNWIKTGAITEDKKHIKAEFDTTISDYFTRRTAFFEDKKRLTKHYESKYQELIEEAKKLKGSLSAEDAANLLNRWNENGSVPSSIYQPLNKEFRYLLKTMRKSKRESINPLERIQKEITETQNPKEDQLKKWLNALQRFEPKSQRQTEVHEELNHLVRKKLDEIFILSLARRKARNLNEKSAVDQKKIKISVVKDLLNRDLQDLKKIELNSEKFMVKDDNLHKLMSKKVQEQRLKISIKESILAELKSGQ